MLSLIHIMFMAVFYTVSVLSQFDLNIINNDGTLSVDSLILTEKGYGNYSLSDTNYVRPCKDITKASGTPLMFYTVSMGHYRDYILPKTVPNMPSYPCRVLTGTISFCDTFRFCRLFMYSPYHPYDREKFNIEDIVVDVKYFSNIFGSSQQGITKDGRETISDWGAGADSSKIGGCCRTTNDRNESEKWGKPYNITATPLNMSILYLIAPKLSGDAPSFVINSKVTDLMFRYDGSAINAQCTWEVKEVETGAIVTVSSINCVLMTGVKSDSVDRKFSVTVSIKSLHGHGNKVFWKTNTGTATAYIVVPGWGVPKTTLNVTKKATGYTLSTSGTKPITSNVSSTFVTATKKINTTSPVPYSGFFNYISHGISVFLLYVFLFL